MSKVKSKIFDAIQNPLAGRGHGIPSLSGISVGFYTSVDGVIMRTKPDNPPHTTPAQLEQQARWVDGDCMWKSRTGGQDQLFWNYYSTEYKAGRTRKGTSNIQGNQQIRQKSMNRQSFFMSHALRLDLYDFLTKYLQSEWVVDEVTGTEDSWLITANLTNPETMLEATIPFERTFRSR